MVQAKSHLLNVKIVGTCTNQCRSNIHITRHFDTLTVVNCSKYDGEPRGLAQHFMIEPVFKCHVAKTVRR